MAGRNAYRDSDSESNGRGLRLPSLPDRLELLERIMTESITDRRVASYRGRAQFTFFCGAEPDHIGGYAGQLEAVGRCLEWFVFDYVIPELGKTPAEHWLDQQAEKLTARERQDGRDCLRFVLGLFEVGVVEPGKGFLALDLLRPPLSYAVSERVISEEIRPGQLLSGRIFPHRGGHILSGMAALMDRSATARIKDLVQSGKINPKAMTQTLDGVEVEDLLGRCLEEVEHIEDAELIYQRLEHYLQLCGKPMELKHLRRAVQQAAQPLRVAAELAETLEVCGRHEMDLLFAYVLAAWRNEHEKE